MQKIKKNYRPKEVCEILGIGKSTFYFFVKQGKIKTKKLSDRVTVVTEDELQKFLNEGV